MVTNFSSPVKGANSGSSSKLVNYLDKEKGTFFNQESDQVHKLEVINRIDRNGEGQGLKSGQDRFYTFTINPSQRELEHIKNDPEKLKEYTKEVMQNYATNFNRDVTSSDLVWYAKIEQKRSYTYEDKEVQKGERIRGQEKEGNQTHVHIIVSRFKERQQERTASLSPLTNHRKEASKGVKSGFDRVNFINTNEATFDKKFAYNREKTETFDHAKALQSEQQHIRLAARDMEIKASLQTSQVQEQNYKREQRQESNNQI